VSRKPENQFVSGVHKYLPPIGELYRAKMHNPYTAGIPDWWYSGSGGDMWIEYKYIPEIPKRHNTLIVPDLSDLQRQWLDGRHAEGRTVCVLVGCPDGGLVFNKSNWTHGVEAGDFRGWLQTRAALAAWIKSQVSP
jgi:hypothetical protein